jgi:hypothetical protein
VIEPHVLEDGAVIALERRPRFAARGTVLASHLEQVREIGCEPIRQAQVLPPVAEVAHQQPLVACPVPDELDAVQMDVLPAQRDLAVRQQIGIAEIGVEHRVVVLSHRAQQERPRFLEQQLELRQHARVAMVETLRVARLAPDVAAMIDDGERIAVLERAGPALLQRIAHRDGVLRRRGLVDGV